VVPEVRREEHERTRLVRRDLPGETPWPRRGVFIRSEPRDDPTFALHASKESAHDSAFSLRAFLWTAAVGAALWPDRHGHSSRRNSAGRGAGSQLSDARGRSSSRQDRVSGLREQQAGAAERHRGLGQHRCVAARPCSPYACRTGWRLYSLPYAQSAFRSYSPRGRLNTSNRHRSGQRWRTRLPGGRSSAIQRRLAAPRVQRRTERRTRRYCDVHCARQSRPLAAIHLCEAALPSGTHRGGNGLDL
jgi:hypothetical protein